MEATPMPVPPRFDRNGSALARQSRSTARETTASRPAKAVTRPRRDLDPVELPARRGLSGPTLATAAVILGCAAIVLGAWGVVRAVTSGSGSPTTSMPALERVTALLAKPTTVRLPLRHSGGHIVLAVSADGTAALVLEQLAAAPAGRTYQAWVVRRGSRDAVSAGVFSGSELARPLTAVVPPAATVGVTLERAGGASAPTSTLRMVVVRPAKAS